MFAGSTIQHIYRVWNLRADCLSKEVLHLDTGAWFLKIYVLGSWKFMLAGNPIGLLYFGILTLLFCGFFVPFFLFISLDLSRHMFISVYVIKICHGICLYLFYVTTISLFWSQLGWGGLLMCPGYMLCPHSSYGLYSSYFVWMLYYTDSL